MAPLLGASHAWCQLIFEPRLERWPPAGLAGLQDADEGEGDGSGPTEEAEATAGAIALADVGTLGDEAPTRAAAGPEGRRRSKDLPCSRTT